ncbi:MAG: hypothetical protein ACK4MF_11565 [Hyphomicrobiaceae bacterium]
METFLGALVWIVSTLWSVIWLLIGGWVSAALQIIVVVLAIFAYRYGWREAPYRAWRGARAVGRWAWAWLRGAEAMAAANDGGGAARVREVEVIRTIRVRNFGDVNLSSLMNAAMMLGLALLTNLPG